MVAVAAFAASAAGSAGGGKDHRYLAPDKIGCQFWKLVISAFCEALFDHDILTLDVTGLGQILAEGQQQVRNLPR
jgi:hypothetical protein